MRSPISAQVQKLVIQAASALNAGDPANASALAKHAVELDADNAGAHYLLGLAALRLNAIDHAVHCLGVAVSLDQGNAEYAVRFAQSLARAERIGDALRAADHAASLAPVDAATLDGLGMVYMRCHAHDRATLAFRQAVALAPAYAIGHFNLAIALTITGETDMAEAEFDACLAIRPESWRAYGLRARLRKQTAVRNHLDELSVKIAAHANHVEARMHLHSAMGKEYEDLGDIAQAFEHFSQCKSVGQAQRTYTSSLDEARVDAIIRAFPGSAHPSEGCASEEPIFIIGMPRSGTTLVERIISSHPDVFSAGELPNLGRQVTRLLKVASSPLPGPEALARAHHLEWKALGECYIESTRPQTGSKRRFIDKLPHNFLNVGFMAHALPRAKIICLRRNPMDTCLSNFRELFMENSLFHGYTFDLLDIGRFYIQFDRLMTHWKNIFPDRIIEIDYETLVAEQEHCSRQLIFACKLPWNDACLDFEHNQAPVATASHAQVREAIYNTSIRRWEKYGSRLEPLERLLNEAGIDTRG